MLVTVIKKKYICIVIDIERHIEILLLSNDCVVVPGLGGFVAHHVSARYDARDGMFLPPLRTLGFNPMLTMNDSLLAQSYVEAYDISYPQAMRKIEDEVSTLRHRLFDEGMYDMHGIGQLYVNKEGKIEFNPLEAGILTPVFYGLGGFEMLPLKDSKRLMKEATEQPGMQEKEKKARIITITTDEQSGQKMVSVSVKALRNVAVAAMFIIALFFIVSPLSNNPRLLSVERVQSSIFSDIFSSSSKNKADKQLQSNDGKTAATENVAPAQKKEKKAETPKEQWVIVLCSHVGEKNAKWFKDELAKENIEARVINAETGNAKVVYGNYPSKEKAQEALSAMKSNKHFDEAWLLQTK